MCDRCEGSLTLRDDDKPETVKKRLEVYHQQTQPLIDFYQSRDCLVRVDGTKDVEEVFLSILELLGV